MRAVQVAKGGGGLELVERDRPEPGQGQVLVRVTACGVCHSDAMTLGGFATAYPRIPGHEVAGVVEATGDGVNRWYPGQRVGVGWFGGACLACTPCREGDYISCAAGQVTGLSADGGYAEYVVAPQDALAAIPDGMPDAEAAPLMCAGVTCFNALRNSGAKAGDLVGIVGLGGLGHLGVQFAAKMGFEVVAIARGEEKGGFARRLGAHHYVDSTSQDVAGELLRLGGASTVLATVTHQDAMTAPLAGLRHRGSLIVIGAPHEPLRVDPLALILKSRSVTGHASGTAKDSEDGLRFAQLVGVHPQIEEFPLEQATAAYDRMLAGEVRFRAVLTL